MSRRLLPSSPRSHPISETRRVLLLGASNLTFSDTVPEESIAALTGTELRSQAPGGDWDCQVRPLTYGPRMAEVAERHLRNERPAAVLLSLVHSPFAEEVPIAVIRRRWPRLYPYARRIAERLKTLAGGADVHTLSALPYRLARSSLGIVIGREPEVLVDDAIRYTIDTVDVLARFEDVAVVCGFFMRLRITSPAATSRQHARVEKFQAAVRAHCDRRHIEVFDRDAEFARFSREHGASSRDAAYGNLVTRSFTGNLIARRLLANLDSRDGRDGLTYTNL